MERSGVGVAVIVAVAVGNLGVADGAVVADGTAVDVAGTAVAACGSVGDWVEVAVGCNVGVGVGVQAASKMVNRARMNSDLFNIFSSFQ
jgi:hypothetical protein